MSPHVKYCIVSVALQHDITRTLRCSIFSDLSIEAENTALSQFLLEASIQKTMIHSPIFIMHYPLLNIFNFITIFLNECTHCLSYSGINFIFPLIFPKLIHSGIFVQCKVFWLHLPVFFLHPLFWPWCIHALHALDASEPYYGSFASTVCPGRIHTLVTGKNM